jgi:hypothetical protein
MRQRGGEDSSMACMAEPSKSWAALARMGRASRTLTQGAEPQAVRRASGLSQHVVLRDHGELFGCLYQCFTEDIGLQLQLTVSAIIPDILTLRF